jgi:hypothetical protein
MSRNPWPILLYAGAALFGAAFLFQLNDIVFGGDSGGARMTPAPSPSTIAAPAAPADAGIVHADRHPEALLRTILARPLFSQSRRPSATPAAAAAPATSEAADARLTGVVVGGGRRIALFVPETGKPLGLVEGDRLGEWTIDRIEAKRVVLRGPAGTKVLEPAVAKASPPPAETAPSLPADAARFLKGLRQ